MAKGIIRSLLGGLYDYAQQPSQDELLAMQMGNPRAMNPLQNSQMAGQYDAARMGLPQSGFSGQMSPAATMGQSPAMPVDQPGLMSLIAQRYENIQNQQQPMITKSQLPMMTGGIMGINPTQNDNYINLLRLMGAK